jgi:hypothetical protein
MTLDVEEVESGWCDDDLWVGSGVVRVLSAFCANESSDG